MSDYRISEVAARTGLSAPTLRYYERIGLIPEPARRPSGYRVYSDEHLRVLDFIARAKPLGLPLEEMRTLVEAWTQKDCRATREQLFALVDGKLAAVRHLIGDLLVFRDQLEEVLATLAAAPAPTRCGPGCGCEIEVSRVGLDLSRDLNLVSLKPRNATG